VRHFEFPVDFPVMEGVGIESKTYHFGKVLQLVGHYNRGKKKMINFEQDCASNFVAQ
jgi:hypothetical protein